MLCGRQLGSALLYAAVSSLLTFSNKALPSEFGFNYPHFVLILQMALMQLVLVVLAAVGAIKYPKISARGLVQHLPVSFMYSLNATVALASLQAVSIPTYGVLKRAGPLFVMLISACAKYLHSHAIEQKHAQLEMVSLNASGRDPADAEKMEEGCGGVGGGGRKEKEADGEHGPGVVVGVVVIVIGAFLTGHADLYLTREALTLALVSNVTQSTYVLLVEAKHKGKAGIGLQYEYGEEVDPTLGLLAYNSMLSLPMLVVLTGVLYALLGEGVIGFMNSDRYSTPLIETVLIFFYVICF
jgi:hypothetical protein